MARPTSDEPFVSAGKKVATIPVKISYRIIELFSEGLYTSPTKAIEELISNSFDAGARHVNVVLSPNLTDPAAIIAVIDDGESMDAEGLRQHWLIGASNKRELKKTPRGRAQIGKFGIGKLATFVLARHLTHICKRGSKYYAATMDYSEIPEGKKGGVEFEGEEVLLPLRELSASETKTCLPGILFGEKEGFKAIPLFGKSAPPSWTIAILSKLK